MNAPRFGLVVEYVTDIEAATRFYVDVMGLKIERHHPTFVQFDHFAIAGDEPMTGGGGPELYWLVDNAEATFRNLPQEAEVCLPIVQKPFGKVLGIKNRDGQPRFLLQLAQSRPSKAAT